MLASRQRQSFNQLRDSVDSPNLYGFRRSAIGRIGAFSFEAS